jgi:hypothetical protein
MIASEPLTKKRLGSLLESTRETTVRKLDAYPNEEIIPRLEEIVVRKLKGFRNAELYLANYRRGTLNLRQAGPTFVAAKLVRGQHIERLVAQGLARRAILERNTLRSLAKTDPRQTRHYFIPVKHPSGDFRVRDGVDGRAISIDTPSGRAVVFKGAGCRKPGLRKPIYRYDRNAEITSWQVLGGENRESAVHVIDIATAFKRAYDRLNRKQHPLNEKIALAKQNGASFPPIMMVLGLFSLKQRPVLTRDESVRPKNNRERAVTSFLQKREQTGGPFRGGSVLKTVGPAGLPEGIAKEQVVLAFEVHSPDRLMSIGNIGLHRILPHYDMEYAGKKITFRGKTVSNTQALELVVKAFAARQAISVLVAKEADALTRSRRDYAFSIFSSHNTTIAGENVDYDTVELHSEEKEKEEWLESDNDQIRCNIHDFARALAKKLQVGRELEIDATARALTLFDKIISPE